MEADKTFALKFSEKDEAILQLVKEAPDFLKYQLIKSFNDLESNTKRRLVITMVETPLTDKEKLFLGII